MHAINSTLQRFEAAGILRSRFRKLHKALVRGLEADLLLLNRWVCNFPHAGYSPGDVLRQRAE